MLAALLAMLVAAASQAAPDAASDLRAWFIDVGQGDAAVIRSPSGKWVLVDGGPPAAGPRLAAFLKEQKAPPMDMVVLSHAHLDHVGGIADVVRGPGIKLLLDPGYPHPLPQYEQLLELLKEKSIPVKDAVAGRNVDFKDGAMLEILWPPRPLLDGTRSDVNANSVVARLVYKDVRVLFMGDAEAIVEDKLLAAGAGVQAQVLKVAHHGSRHSSTATFLKAVHPEVAVISVSKFNDYKHPHPDALARLRAVGAKILATSEVGTVALKTDGKTYTVTPAHDADTDAHSSGALAVKATGYAASAKSKVFHRAECSAVGRIKPENLVHFETREEAASGRKPAKDCDP